MDGRKVMLFLLASCVVLAICGLCFAEAVATAESDKGISNKARTLKAKNRAAPYKRKAATKKVITEEEEYPEINSTGCAHVSMMDDCVACCKVDLEKLARPGWEYVPIFETMKNGNIKWNKRCLCKHQKKWSFADYPLPAQQAA